MSQFYDLASLVVIPSGYKASTIYAQKPLTTDGQLSFTRASTATRVNASGLIEAVASNVPRLDYLGSSCPRLNLEPQRTNVALSSEQFNDSTYWVASNSVVAANSAVSPDGNQNADLWYPSTSGDVSSRRLLQSSTVSSAGINVTASVFVKRNNKRWLYFVGPDATSPNHNCWFDLQNGVVGTKGSLVVSATINDFGNGWYRCSVTSLSTSTSQYVFLSATDTDADGTVTASGTNGLYLYGAQIEAGAYATSYIPTLAASVTRVADAAIKTGISSLIGQTEGTLFLDFDFTNISTIQVILSLHDGANNKRLEIWASSNTLYGFIGGSVNIDIGNLNLTNGRHKVAMAYKQSGEQAFYVDGVQVGTSATAYTISALTALSYDFWNTGYPPTAAVRQTLLFKTRLTNAQLAELTAL